MSKFDKYREVPSVERLSKFDKYREEVPAEQSIVSTDNKEAWGELIAKSLASGVISLADLPQFIGSLLEKSSHNLLAGDMYDETNAPTNFISSLKPVSKHIQEATGIDLTPEPKTELGRIASHAANFAGGSVLPIGAAAKSLKGLAGQVGVGSAIGGASGAMQEGGVDQLVADITTSVLVPGIGAIPRTALDKTAAKLVGLSPKSIDLNTALAAKDFGINLPASALTENYLTNLIEHSGKKSFFTKNIHNEKAARLDQKVEEIIDNIIERSGKADTPENRELNKMLYNIVEQNTTPIKPSATHQSTNDIFNNIAESLTPNAHESKVVKDALRLKKSIAPYNKAIDTPVNRLVATKRSWNNMIDWDAPTDVKSLSKKIPAAIKEDLKVYGQQDPEWYAKFIEADKMYGDIQRRKELQDVFNSLKNPATGKYGNYKLAKGLNEPERQKSLLKLVEKEDRKKIRDLSKISGALYKQNLRNPNPSGTATTTQALKGFTNPLEYAAQVLPLGIISSVIDSPSFINRAVERAANPTAHRFLPQIGQGMSPYFPPIITREQQRD